MLLHYDTWDLRTIQQDSAGLKVIEGDKENDMRGSFSSGLVFIVLWEAWFYLMDLSQRLLKIRMETVGMILKTTVDEAI